MVYFDIYYKSTFFQKQSMLVRQLEEELRMRMRGPNMELQQQVELLLNENDHLTREVAILRETIKVNTELEGYVPNSSTIKQRFI